MSLILRHPWRQQPQGAAPVDWGNPLARGLLAATIPHRRRDLVGGKSFTQRGAYAAAVASAGIGLSTDGSSSSIYLPIPAVTLTRWSLLAVIKANSPGVDTRAVALGSSSSSTPIIQIGTHPSDATRMRVWARGAINIDTDAITASTPFDGAVHAVAVTYDGTTIRSFVDGVEDASLSRADTFAVDRFSVGALERSSAAVFWRGATFFAAAYSRDLAAPEARALTSSPAAPWQLFAPRPRRIFVSAGTGPSDATGALAATLAGATLAADGAVTNRGALASTLDGATLEASGTVEYTGAIATSLDGCSMAASGTVESPGAFAATLDGISMAATGTVGSGDVEGSFASTLDGLSMVAAGDILVPGLFASTLEGAQMAASGTVAPHVDGAFAGLLDGFWMSASGYLGDEPPMVAGLFPWVRRRRR